MCSFRGSHFHLLREIKQLRSALEYSRPFVEKWCHYQGDNEQFVKDILKPIDLALEKGQKDD